ncbi:MAG: HDIG domain-containing protein [Desulfobacterales bacterium]
MKYRKRKESVISFFKSNTAVRWGILVVVTAIFTLMLYPNLVVTRRSYEVGDVAQRDVKAPKDFFIEDKIATEAKRRQAADSILTVYDFDTELAGRLKTRVNRAFSLLQAVYQPSATAAPAPQPVGDPTVPADPDNPTQMKLGPPSPEEIAAERQERAWQLKGEFQSELGIAVSDGAYAILEKHAFSEAIAGLITDILAKTLGAGVVSNKEILLRVADKGIMLRVVGSQSEKPVFNLEPFYGLDQAKSMVRIIGQPYLKDLEYTLRNLIVDFIQQLIQPNITLNRNETETRKEAAAAEIKPILYQIKAGEMLLREGERLTQVQLLKLQTLQDQTRNTQLWVRSAGTALLILCLLVTACTLHARNHIPGGQDHNKTLLFLATVFLIFLFVAKISFLLARAIAVNEPFGITHSAISYGIPLAAGAMSVCLFLCLDWAIAFSVVTAVSVAVLFHNRLEIFIYFLINSSMAAYWLQNCRERRAFIRAGTRLGLLNVVLVTALNLYSGDVAGIRLLWNWAFAFLGGVGAGLVAAGIAPLLEVTFDYTTDIKLLELANLDRPILRRLMIEAPGTYHHSVIVGSMVEAAATAIGANSLLAKVCGYYHDIGKIRKPLYFIENQIHGKNKHDKLAPSMSALILIAHVKEGVEIARENKLGQAITDTIRQHHGTSLISYFFEKAKQRRGEENVNIDDYRYPGPRPQTREAGLVMLADVVEAASRTLENPTPSRIQGHVQNLINKVFSDGQLDECELTLKDLHQIAKSFNKILNGIHHHRIEYSENLAAASGKSKNGSSDRQPPKPSADSPKETKAGGTGRLKRLGLS